jgi:hypothetical protein
LRQTRYRWRCGYLFPDSAQTDLAKVTPLEVKPALDQVDLEEISGLKRLRFGRLAVPPRMTGDRVRHGAVLVRLRRTCTNRLGGIPMFTWAIPELGFVTGDRPCNTDFRFSLAGVREKSVARVNVTVGLRSNPTYS